MGGDTGLGEPVAGSRDELAPSIRSEILKPRMFAPRLPGGPPRPPAPGPTCGPVCPRGFLWGRATSTSEGVQLSWKSARAAPTMHGEGRGKPGTILCPLHHFYIPGFVNPMLF